MKHDNPGGDAREVEAKRGGCFADERESSGGKKRGGGRREEQRIGERVQDVHGKGLSRVLRVPDACIIVGGRRVGPFSRGEIWPRLERLSPAKVDTWSGERVRLLVAVVVVVVVDDVSLHRAS